MIEYWQILMMFFVIAVVYSSIGLGGGSSYLAILAISTLPYQDIRIIALICNIIVVSGSATLYIRNKYVNWKKIIPITLISMPLSYLGATTKISERTFFQVLGTTLIIAAILLLLHHDKEADLKISKEKYANILQNSFIGGGIGFLSGMVGIGGGIFLSPLLHLMRWDTAKRIASTSSIFILANSISGIAGQLSNLSREINYSQIPLFAGVVLVGGQIGTRTSLKWNPIIIKRMTAALVFMAGVNVLIKYW